MIFFIFLPSRFVPAGDEKKTCQTGVARQPCLIKIGVTDIFFLICNTYTISFAKDSGVQL